MKVNVVGLSPHGKEWFGEVEVLTGMGNKGLEFWECGKFVPIVTLHYVLSTEFIEDGIVITGVYNPLKTPPEVIRVFLTNLEEKEWRSRN